MYALIGGLTGWLVGHVVRFVTVAVVRARGLCRPARVHPFSDTMDRINAARNWLAIAVVTGAHLHWRAGDRWFEDLLGRGLEGVMLTGLKAAAILVPGMGMLLLAARRGQRRQMARHLLTPSPAWPYRSGSSRSW